MKFNYLARSKEGQVQKGVVEASSEEAALTVLQKFGLFVTSLEVIKPLPVYAKQIKLFNRVSQKDIAVFARQLSIMFASQVPIVEALLAIARQTEKTRACRKDKKSQRRSGRRDASFFCIVFVPQSFLSFFCEHDEIG